MTGLLLAWLCFFGELMQINIALGVIICPVSLLQDGVARQSLHTAR